MLLAACCDRSNKTGEPRSVLFEGYEVAAIEIAEAPGRSPQPRVKRTTDLRELEHLVSCLNPRPVLPTGGEDKWHIRIFFRNTDQPLRNIWVFDYGEWGYDGRSRGHSDDLPEVLEQLLNR